MVAQKTPHFPLDKSRMSRRLYTLAWPARRGSPKVLIAIQNSIGELRGTVSALKAGVETNEKTFRSDFRWTWGGIAAGVVVIIGAIMGMFFSAYFKLDDRISAAASGLVRIETKVDQLVARPAPLPPSILPGR